MASSTTITIRLGGPDASIRLQRKLDEPREILTGIGAIVVAQGQRAFREQRLGDVIWPERYPKQKDPFINIAPVVFKAGQGQAPTADDFRKRPALGGPSSDLAKSLAFKVAGNAVECGSPFDWAGLFQFGGIGRIPITDTTRATLGQWLFKSKTNQRFASKLAFVFQRDELVQGTYPRPFLGFTDQTFVDVSEFLAGHFDGKAAA